MIPFDYTRAQTIDYALRAAVLPGAKLLAGGTNLVDLMKNGVETPAKLIDITHLDMTTVAPAPQGGIRIGALVRNSDLANHPLVLRQYPLLSQALLSGASPQLRNMATTGGNLLQRTRCYYFTDPAFPACNKRNPGSGCAAIKGYNRIHAILGQTDNGSEAKDTCIATHPSDMCVALAALDATVDVQSASGKRAIPFADFHLLPGGTPWIETALQPGELITSVTLPPSRFAAHSHYLKARDRHSYAFALISVAAALEVTSGTIHSAAIALGGVALRPWRIAAAEQALVGKPTTEASFALAADLLLQGAKTYEHNAFKVKMAHNSIVRALTLAAQGVHA
jgi:xanthine dehydrogenase YagS FAD-binding subunit